MITSLEFPLLLGLLWLVDFCGELAKMEKIILHVLMNITTLRILCWHV